MIAGSKNSRSINAILYSFFTILAIMSATRQMDIKANTKAEKTTIPNPTSVLCSCCLLSSMATCEKMYNPMIGIT